MLESSGERETNQATTNADRILGSVLMTNITPTETGITSVSVLQSKMARETISMLDELIYSSVPAEHTFCDKLELDKHFKSFVNETILHIIIIWSIKLHFNKLIV